MKVQYLIRTRTNSMVRGLTSIQPGMTVTVNRSCELGQASKEYNITTLGAAASLPATIDAWIAADIVTLEAAKVTRDANGAIQAAFNLVIGDLAFEVDI